jgi:hypothetical protein
MAETCYGEITVALELVETPEEAERLRFAGSPTLLLDGDDVRERGAILPARELARVVNEISDDVLGFGPIEYLLKDPSVTEVVVDGWTFPYLCEGGIASRITAAARAPARKASSRAQASRQQRAGPETDPHT